MWSVLLFGWLAFAKASLYHYKNIKIDSLVLSYRTGFILSDEDSPGSISFDVAVVVPKSESEKIEDKLVQLTIFSVDDVLNGNMIPDSSLDEFLASNLFCCVDQSDICPEVNALSMLPEDFNINKNAYKVFYIDLVNAEKELDGDYITEASGTFVAPKSGLYSIMFSYCDAESSHILVSGVSEWRSYEGLIPAELYGLLSFYENMSIFYLILAALWGYSNYRKWKQLLLLQNWISFVLVISLFEVYSRYYNFYILNNEGVVNKTILIISFILMAIKKSFSRMLIMVVSSGFGVIRPKLGDDIDRVVNFGLLYLTFSFLSEIIGVYNSPLGSTETSTNSFISVTLELPIIALDIYFVYWTFKLLKGTIISLETREETAKCQLYRWFQNLLLYSIVTSSIVVVTSFYVRLNLPVSWSDPNYESRVFTWKNMYLFTCFWDVLYFFLLIAVMYLWLPSDRSLKYAYASQHFKKDDEFLNEFDDDLSEDDTDELKLHSSIETEESTRLVAS